MDEGSEEGEILPLEKIKNRLRDVEMQLYNNETAIDALARGAGAGSFSGTGDPAAAGGRYSDPVGMGGEIPRAFSAGGNRPDSAGNLTSAGHGTEGSRASSASGAGTMRIKQELPPALPEEIRKIVENWSAYASQTPPGSRRISLTQARLSLGDQGQLLIIFDKEYGNPYLYQRKDDAARARVDNDRLELKNFLQSKVGRAIEIEYRVLDKNSRLTDSYVDLLSLVEPGAIQMPIETEEE